MKKWGLYEWSVVFFFLVIPLIAIIAEYLLHTSLSREEAILKWFVFCGVGLRLFSAGIKQAVTPQFTAKEIFHLEGEEAVVIVRELGLANICFGILGLLSIGIPSFRIPAAVGGGLYFGFAGILHIGRKVKESEEIFAMASDWFIFFILAAAVGVNILVG